MARNPSVLFALRQPSLFRDVLVSVLAGLTLMMPCYAGIPDWWVTRKVVKPAGLSDNATAVNIGQLKHAVTQAVAEMNERLAADGGAGVELNTMVVSWEASAMQSDNYEMANVGQVKAVLKLWYDRLNSIHNTNGYPWGNASGSANFEAINIGQLKKLLRIDVRLPWTQNLAEGYGATAAADLQPPGGNLNNLKGVLSARDHYLRNPLLNQNARGSNPLALPANAENIPSIPVATTAGEFKVGQDGAANYTIRLQGPKGVANVEPAISLQYSSNSGDGILGIGWSLAGLSVINRGPTSIKVDGAYDAADFDSNDRVYLDGERLICTNGAYWEDGSEYRTVKEQFSKIVYHKSGTEDWFEVFTKAGLVMEFGHCATSSIGPLDSSGQLSAGQKTAWAVCKVRDSLGNFWRVQYADSGPGADLDEDTPYLPDYQPSLITYTGGPGREAAHEMKFIYEARPDGHRGYMLGNLVRKVQRLCGIEIKTNGVPVRSWRLRYNLDHVNHIAQPAQRSCLTFVQEVAGGYADKTASALPATQFGWDEGSRTWGGLAETEQPMSLSFPGGTPPFLEDDYVGLEYNIGNATFWMQKSAQYIDLNGDGMNEILFSHRGPLVKFFSDTMRIYDYRQILQRASGGGNGSWEVSYFPGETYGSVRQYLENSSASTGSYTVPSGVSFSSMPKRATDFPYLTTAAAVPTGAQLMDLNQDGLVDIVSSGSFDYVAFTYENSSLTAQPSGEILNAAGVWLNQGGTFVKDQDGITDTTARKDVYSGAPLQSKDNWGAWRFPLVPCEFTSSDGGALAGRPSGAVTAAGALDYLRMLGVLQDSPTSPATSFTIPAQYHSGTNEVLGYPQFALFREHDLGWRFVDMDGDGDTDIIRAGHGYEEAGWMDASNNPATASPIGTGNLNPKGRELCFGLRNNGPNAPAGQRWTLINPSDEVSNPAKHLKSIWKLPLPLVDDNGKVDMGRRLIDLNGDGLPDFLAQKQRTAPDPLAPWTRTGYNDCDIEVWINRGEDGWEHGGDEWKLEGVMISNLTASGAQDLDYGRMLQDMNGDGLPDFVVSFHYVVNDLNLLQEGVFLNTGKGWAKKIDTASGRYLARNHLGLIPPEPLFYNRVPRPYSLVDLNGDGRPEFLNGRDAEGFELPGTTDKIGRTHFMSALGGWIVSPHLTSDQDWNLPDELLAGSSVPLNFTELDGDGMMDVLRTQRTGTSTKTYFRPSQYKPARINKIVNGLGIAMNLSYGNLPRLAGNTAEHHYRNGTPSTETQVSSSIPPSVVVTGMTTLDGTEDATGSGGSPITTSYFYSGLRSHALHGGLGFGSMETRMSNSPVRQVTRFGQEEHTVGLPISGETYHVVEGQAVLLSENATAYTTMNVEPSLEAPGKHSTFTYASNVANTNWSPEGAYLGKTISAIGYGTTGADKGMMNSQVVTQDNATASNASDDSSVSTVHEYDSWVTGAGEWRIGQIKKTTVTSNAPGTPSVAKVSAFEYYPTGHAHAGMLKKETINPDSSAVSNEHIYDSNGNEVKTITSAPGAPSLVSETWYDTSGRFAEAAVNSLGHATRSTYDPVHSLATSSTLAFQGPVPTAGTSHSATAPGAPPGTLVASTFYDIWGTAKVTTGPDGHRSLRIVQYFIDPSLPTALYYTYEQTEGSPPVITYFDRYHRALLVEKTGFGGETIFQEKQYDAKGRSHRVSKPYIGGADSPAYTVEEYDAYDRKTKVTAPDGSWVAMTYSGFAVTMTNHRSQQQTRLADMQERVIQSIDTDGNSVAFAYTADGLPRSTSVTYADSSPGSTITTTYNELRLKESVTDPNTGTSSSFYDAHGRMIATTDGNGVSSVIENDLGGRVTKRWTGVTSYTLGQVPAAFETLTETVYDTAPGMGIGKPHTTAFTHNDGASQRTVTESFVYDLQGRPVQNTTTLAGQVDFNGSYTTSTTYLANGDSGYGRVATVTDPGGFTRSSDYNSLGFLNKVIDQGTGKTLWQGIAYDAEGRTLKEHFGNGMGRENSYHPTRGFVESSRTVRTASQSVVQNLQMQVNDLGNVEWRKLTRYESEGGTPLTTPEERTESFSFDSQNRLTSSYVVGKSVQSFSYSSNGNIMSKTRVADQYSYGAAGAGPHAVTGISLGTSSRRYTYDAKGRMLDEYYKPNAAAAEARIREIAYTSFDQARFIQHWGSAALSSDLSLLDDGMAAWDNVSTINFYFGPGLQRLIQTKVKGLQFTKSLSLGGYEIRETRLGGFGAGNDLVEKEERSSFGNGARVKRWTAASPSVPVIAFEYGVGDHLGSDSATYDGEGQLQMQRGHLKSGEVQKSERQSYDAWGSRRDAADWSPAPGQLGDSPSPTAERGGSNLARGFTGHEMLDDVGLIHMNGRLYDPGLGRMCAADPYVQTPENVQNYNRYSYVLNNPLSQIDPSGHFIVGLIVGIVAAVIAIVGAVIVTVAAFIAYLAALAVQFVVTVVSAVVQAFGAIGNALLTAAKTGVALVSGGSAAAGGAAAGGAAAAAAGGGLTVGKVLLGAAIGAVYNGIQAAINGGGISDILKAAAMGAVTGAVGAVVGAAMHGLGEAVGSMLTEGGASITGTVVHLAAHGAAGGGMSAAMGGSFKDGFIGGLIGAGVSGVSGALPFTKALQGQGGLKIIGRTAVAGLSGGVASVLAGGKFTDGAFSAAFFHLFNNEARRWWISEALQGKKRLAALVDWGDQGGVVNGEPTATHVQLKEAARLIQAHQYDIRSNWQNAMAAEVSKYGKYDVIYIIDHGKSGSQQFGAMTMSSATWEIITSNYLAENGTVVLLGCNVAEGLVGDEYLMSLGRSAFRNGKSGTPTVVGYTGRVYYTSRTGGGDQKSATYNGAGDYKIDTIIGYGSK